MSQQKDIFLEELESMVSKLLQESLPEERRAIKRPDHNELKGQKNSSNAGKRAIVGAQAGSSRRAISVGTLFQEYQNNKNSGLFSMLCIFCKQNCEHPSIYTSHNLKDDSGVVQCPILRKYECPNCGATGDKAHTVKYCPLTPASTKHSFRISEASKMRMANGRKRI